MGKEKSQLNTHLQEFDHVMLHQGHRIMARRALIFSLPLWVPLVILGDSFGAFKTSTLAYHVCQASRGVKPDDVPLAT